jgi:hypothetical protein
MAHGWCRGHSLAHMSSAWTAFLQKTSAQSSTSKPPIQKLVPGVDRQHTTHHACTLFSVYLPSLILNTSPHPCLPTLSVTVSAARQSLKNSARSRRRLASLMACRGRVHSERHRGGVGLGTGRSTRQQSCWYSRTQCKGLAANTWQMTVQVSWSAVLVKTNNSTAKLRPAS